MSKDVIAGVPTLLDFEQSDTEDDLLSLDELPSFNRIDGLFKHSLSRGSNRAKNSTVPPTSWSQTSGYYETEASWNENCLSEHDWDPQHLDNSSMDALLHKSCGSRGSVDSHTMSMSTIPSRSDLLIDQNLDSSSLEKLEDDQFSNSLSNCDPSSSPLNDNRGPRKDTFSLRTDERLKAATEKSRQELHRLTSSQTCLPPTRTKTNFPSEASESDFDDTSASEFFRRNSNLELLTMTSESSSLLDSSSSLNRHVTIRDNPEIVLFSEEDRPWDVSRRITVKRRIRWRLREWRHTLVRTLNLTNDTQQQSIPITGQGDSLHRPYGVASDSSSHIYSSDYRSDRHSALGRSL